MDNIFLPQIVNNPLLLPDDMNPQLRDLLEGILCKGTVSHLLQDFESQNVVCFLKSLVKFVFEKPDHL